MKHLGWTLAVCDILPGKSAPRFASTDNAYRIKGGAKRDMLDHVDAYTLSVRDLESCVAFYHEKLGFKLEFKEVDFAYLTFGGQGLRGLGLEAAESEAKMTSHAQKSPKEGTIHGNHFVVFVDDVDKEFEALKAKGVHFVSPLTTGRFGQRIGCFEDPEGNLWEISNHIG